MKSIAVAVSLVVLAPLGASAQTTDQLVKGATDTANTICSDAPLMNRFSDAAFRAPLDARW